MKMKCHSCCAESLPTTRYCLFCFVKEAVRKTLGITDSTIKTEFAAILLEKLHQQNFKCFYTQRDLVPGVNLSLDHVLPKSWYPEGRTDIDNLVWTDLRCNQAKNNLPLSAFVSLCEDVVKNKANYCLTQEGNS